MEMQGCETYDEAVNGGPGLCIQVQVLYSLDWDHVEPLVVQGYGFDVLRVVCFHSEVMSLEEGGQVSS